MNTRKYHTNFAHKSVNIFSEMMFATQFVLDRFGLFKCNTFDGWKRRTQKLFIHILRYCISHSINTKLTYSMANSIFGISMFESPPSLFTNTIAVCVMSFVYICIGLCYTFHFWSSVAVATIASYYPTARKPIWFLSLWQIFECVICQHKQSPRYIISKNH